MFRLSTALIVALFIAAPAFPAGNNDAAQALFMANLRAAGYFDSNDNIELSDNRSARDLFKLEALVENARLSQGEIKVVEYNKSLLNSPAVGGGARLYFEKISVPNMAPDGSSLLTLRQLHPEEVAKMRAGSEALPSEQLAEAMRGYAGGLLMVGAGLQEEINNSAFGAEFAGSQPIMASLMGIGQYSSVDDDMRIAFKHGNCAQNVSLSTIDIIGSSQPSIRPWETISPIYFLMGPACFLSTAADRLEETIAPEDEAAIARGMQAFADAVVSNPAEDELDGQTVLRIDAHGLNISQPLHGPDDPRGYVTPEPESPETLQRSNGTFAKADVNLATSSLLSGFAPTLSLQASAKSVAVASSAADNTMTIEKMSVWIDPEYFVRRKMRMEGVIRRGGKVQDFFLEKEDKDYRTIPGSYLYKPYREEMRMGGMMSQKEQAEMQEAVRKLDDYEMQMASMPASQRAMMEKMMGSQVQQLRNMANGGAVELVLVTTSIVINPDLSSPPGPFGAIPPSSTMDENLVKIVQQHLQSLGYQPGDTNGELDKLTVVAISKFQADNDMEVTGQATPQLAGILAAAVDARN